LTDPTQLPPVSHTTARRRFSAIWIIPLVAVAIGAWLAWDTLSKQGPTITVSFRSAEGLEAGKSLLKFKDIVFGTVKDLQLSPDQTRVVVTIATSRKAEPLLNDQTEFWVVKPRLFAGNVSGLETLLSGSYVGMRPSPKPGKSKQEFVGREDPPVLEADVAGHTFLLKAARLGSISLGSPVFYRDLSVGEVLGWDLADMAESVTLHVFVRAPFDKYVHNDSRFWNASGISIKLGGSGIEVQMESLRALLLGGIAFDAPIGGHQAEVAEGDHVFPLFADRDTANAASYTRKIPLVSYFPGSVRGLAAGSEVTMHGLVVGRVNDVRLSFDRGKDTILAPVHYEVEPERVVGVGVQYFSQEQVVAELVKRGLRASLQSTNLLTGQQAVALETVPDAPPATVEKEGENFIMPTTEGGGFAGLAASATELLNKVNTIPFDDIGKNLGGILQGVNSTVHDPKVQKALTDLGATMASVKEVTANLDKGSAPALKRLPEISVALQNSLTNANKLVESLDKGYGDNTQFNRDLTRLLVQLNDAARSIRSLADLLSRNPEALVKGRPKGTLE
jgi:paraquat-inducible protein B